MECILCPAFINLKQARPDRSALKEAIQFKMLMIPTDINTYIVQEIRRLAKKSLLLANKWQNQWMVRLLTYVAAAGVNMPSSRLWYFLDFPPWAESLSPWLPSDLQTNTITSFNLNITNWLVKLVWGSEQPGRKRLMFPLRQRKKKKKKSFNVNDMCSPVWPEFLPFDASCCAER